MDTEEVRKEFEEFMHGLGAVNFRTYIGVGGEMDYDSPHLVLAWRGWQHMQQRIDALVQDTAAAEPEPEDVVAPELTYRPLSLSEFLALSLQEKMAYLYWQGQRSSALPVTNWRTRGEVITDKQISADDIYVERNITDALKYYGTPPQGEADHVRKSD